MKKRFLLFVIFILFLVSLTTFLLVWNYVDVYENTSLAVFALTFSYILLVSSFFTIVLYAFKKIYYRDNVYIYHVLTSFRQGFLIAVFGASIVYFMHIGIPVIITSILVFFALFALELFIENQEDI